MENAFPIFKVSRLVRVHTDLHHNGHNKMIFAVSYVWEKTRPLHWSVKLMVSFLNYFFSDICGDVCYMQAIASWSAITGVDAAGTRPTATSYTTAVSTAAISFAFFGIWNRLAAALRTFLARRLIVVWRCYIINEISQRTLASSHFVFSQLFLIAVKQHSNVEGYDVSPRDRSVPFEWQIKYHFRSYFEKR